MARRILLADDSVTAQNMGRRILSDAGYEVVTVNNGSAALKKIAEQKPDLIVLDVYMPGYGGLEVCQRIKENRETARIPVLLTVGKLEPFKPEEARRVRADAFIVKPFEASELLTALTKLEDKIVPQGPQKPGRFAKALAAMEQSAAEKDDRFGNSDTGWKDRLSIPPPAAKSAQSEAEAPQLASAVVRQLWRDADSKPAEPKPGFERPLPAGLPPDITPEEIAAITAAAAAFGSKPEERPAKPESEAVAEPEKSQAATETPAPSVASAPEAEAATNEAKPAVSEVQPAAETHVISEATKPDENPVAETPVVSDLPAAQAENDSKAKDSTEAPTVEPGKPWTGDAEVLAAIASLAPTNGHADGGWQPAESSAGSAHGAETPVSAAAMANASAAAETFSGPRWIAEAIPVLEDESRFILEQEMEKAYAAFAAAEGDRTRSAAAAATSSIVVVAERQSPEAPTVIENVREAVAAEVTAMPGAPEASSVISPAKEEAAYAAAASASAVAEGATTTEGNAQPVASPKPEENTSLAPEEGGNQREAELAAAWQNWKQIRESIVGSQLTAQIADAAAAELKDVHRDDPSPAPSENAEVPGAPESDEPSSAARTESTAIASIVDSVLAELKPKLVEEIAKKMSTDKKEKEKKKKK